MGFNFFPLMIEKSVLIQPEVSKIGSYGPDPPSTFKPLGQQSFRNLGIMVPPLLPLLKLCGVNLTSAKHNTNFQKFHYSKVV